MATSRTVAPSRDPDLVTVQGDISDPATAERIIAAGLERFGRVDTLVNNAGIFIAKPFTDYTGDEFAAVTGVNTAGFFHVTQAAIGHMLTQGVGHIVTIISSLVDHADSQKPGAPTSKLADLPALPAQDGLNPWHLGFNQLENLPERLLAGRYRTIIDWSVDQLTVAPEAIDEQSQEIYARAYDSAEAIRAVASWYRTLREDLRIAADFPKLTMPVLVPGGRYLALSRASNEHLATDIRFVEIPDAGHFLSEEQP